MFSAIRQTMSWCSLVYIEIDTIYAVQIFEPIVHIKQISDVKFQQNKKKPQSTNKHATHCWHSNYCGVTSLVSYGQPRPVQYLIQPYFTQVQYFPTQRKSNKGECKTTSCVQCAALPSTISQQYVGYCAGL